MVEVKGSTANARDALSVYKPGGRQGIAPPQRVTIR